MSSIDDAFKAMADKAEQAESDKANKKSYTPNYENVKYVGLVKKDMRIIRFLGEHPNLMLDDKIDPDMTPYDARVVRVAKVIDDKGKTIKLVIPTDDHSHIVWKIVDTVNYIKWVKDETTGKSAKTFPVQEKHPDIFNLINFNGLQESDVKRKFGLEGKGWAGRDYFIANCIERSMYDWHRENKHSAILSKNVNVKKYDDGKVVEFADDGVPAYGVTDFLALRLFRHYGCWEKYDIGWERTGNKSAPYSIINASTHIEEVPVKKQSLVSKDASLTDEEKSWARYDLNKIYKLSSYNKILNKLKITIAMIDSKLGTKFLDELTALAAKEMAEWKANESTESTDADTDEDVPSESEEEEVEVRQVAPPAQPSRPATAQLPPAFDQLSAKEQGLVESATEVGDGKWEIKYRTDEKLAKCPECSNKAPKSFGTCPVCGMKYPVF